MALKIAEQALILNDEMKPTVNGIEHTNMPQSVGSQHLRG